MSMESNPYQVSFPAPQALELDHDSPAPTWIIPVWGAVAATFMAAFFGGSIVIALNLARTKRAGAAIAAVVIGLLSTIAMFGLAYSLPASTPGTLLLGGQLVVVYYVAKSVDISIRDRLYGPNLRYASGWWGAGIGVLACIPLVAMLLAGMYVEEASWGKEYRYQGDSVYFSGDATQADAKFLAQALQDAGWFDGSGNTATIESRKNRYTIGLPVAAESWNDPESVEWARSLAEVLADERFGRPMTIQFCDENMISRKSIKVD